MGEFWNEFLDGLDTPGGHIVLLLVLLASSIGMWQIGFPHWDSVAQPVIGALLMRMTGMRPNRERRRLKELEKRRQQENPLGIGRSE